MATNLIKEKVRFIDDSNRHGLRSKFRFKAPDSTGSIKNADIWDDILILPRRPKNQLDGLIRFARFVNWPEFDTFASRLSQELDESSLATESFLETTYDRPIQSTSTSSKFRLPDTVELAQLPVWLKQQS